ncbi:MAG: addiction module protein [Sulfuricurvum sp.]|uniref:addiction module protein n=1 Tax=Sulfuricurvum sp. TaxID=2025608 RepID=UPI0025CD0D94|nr:addiction module protein [Sulfuricurvum sp.]MCK9374114.1 addiction module protein [Sulfuricurvum sp.]
MTITINDSFADQVIAFLKTLPKEAAKIEPSRPWYADEMKRRVEEYKSGKMETYPLDQDFWDRMDKRIDEMDSH